MIEAGKLIISSVPVVVMMTSSHASVYSSDAKTISDGDVTGATLGFDSIGVSGAISSVQVSSVAQITF